MNATALKKKLKNDFEKIIDDESNLENLEKVFSKIIAESEREDEGATQKPSIKIKEVKSWEDFKKKMKAKYGY